MARGNDAAEARRDLDSQYGEHESAESLIQAHDDSLDHLLIAALNKPVDEAATAAIDEDDIEPRFGGEIVAHAVRGGMLVVVERVGGQLRKWGDADHAGVPKKAKRRHAPAAEKEKETAPDPSVPAPPPPAQTPPPPPPASSGSGSSGPPKHSPSGAHKK